MPILVTTRPEFVDFDKLPPGDLFTTTENVVGIKIQPLAFHEPNTRDVTAVSLKGEHLRISPREKVLMTYMQAPMKARSISQRGLSEAEAKEVW